MEYIRQGIFRASFKFCMRAKLRVEKIGGGGGGGVEGMKFFSVNFNVRKPLQIVFLHNFENCRSPFKNETLHKESSQDR